MKKMKQWIGLAVLLSAFTVTFVGPVGCAGTGVSKTSVYAGDNFLFQTEKLSVQAHELFLEFYRWEKDNRAALPVSVSRAADFARQNEKTWAGTLNAAHDAYVNTPTAENKDKLVLALNLLKTALNQAAFYMLDNKATAPNAGLDKANGETLKALGIKPTPPPPTP
jgi:hypothetical protein